jgi:hypothetical protein
MPATLFHGIAGSKSLSLDQLLVAENRMVTNPGGGQLFLSGWHVVDTVEALEGYLKRFKHPDQLITWRFITKNPLDSSMGSVNCKVLVDRFRPKPGSKCLLADKMMIAKEDWVGSDSYSTYQAV